MGATRADRTRASIDSIDQQLLLIGAGSETMSAPSLRRLTGMLKVHAAAVRDARSEMLTIRGPIWRSVEAISKHLVTCICPVLLERFEVLLPTVDNSDAKRRQDEASVIEYADAIAAVFAWETTVGRHVLLRSSISKRLAAVAGVCVARIDKHLQQANDADIPDFRQFGREILRAEVAEWAFRLAGTPEHSAALQQRAGRLARQSVTWAARVFERFKSDPDELSHFDAAATLTAVDDLLLVIVHVKDSDQSERAAGSHPFVLTIGEQALQEFVSALDSMTLRYLQIADQHLLSDGASGSFVQSVLRVLDRIVRVGHVLSPTVQSYKIASQHAATIGRLRGMRDRLVIACAKARNLENLQMRLTILDTALKAIGA